MNTPSPALEMLYGARAEATFAYLENIDPELNAIIQRLAYDEFWLRPGLSTREKSMVTLSALVAMRVTQPLRLHMIGFLSCGGTTEQLRDLLIHLIPYVGFPPVLSAFTIYSEVTQELGFTESETPE